MSTVAVRIAALVALAVALAAAAMLLLSGPSYRVSARFINASQLVKGNLVTVAGEQVGKVESIELAPNGEAVIELSISEEGYAPLREGTRAIVRQLSLSGVANRYVALQLGAGNASEIPDGGVITGESTEAAVDLDELFNTFDPVARTAVQRTIKLFGEFNAGREEEAGEAIRQLNPALASSSRLFDELSRNRPQLERFIDENARLVGDLAARDDDLAGLVENLGTTMDALAAERDNLGEAVQRLPEFLRTSQTTFANLRGTLDSLDPLVADSKPIVRDKLRPLFGELRPFARDARPALRDLSRTIRRPGDANDLIELLRLQPAVDQIANRTAQRNGAARPGAFPAARRALPGISRQLAFQRPYAPELLGWFDDFSTTGQYDALGGFSRSGVQFNAFTFTSDTQLVPVPPALRDEVLAANLETGRNNRCPGSLERTAPDGSNPFIPFEGYDCDPSQVPIGP
jgi:phospholipid/cholesterol/gamma-HCH transport system substrate-binding protein